MITQGNMAALHPRAVAGRALSRLQEAALCSGPPHGAVPLALFLPAAGRDGGAARLRIWKIAPALAAHGWRGVVVPPRLDLEARRRVIKTLAPDVLVMQGARHALNRPGLYPGIPILYDMDDADFHLPHLRDAVHEAMPQVAGVLAGSRYVAGWCRDAGAGQVHTVWTGAPVSSRARPPQAGRPPIVAWAQTRPDTYTREADLVRDVVADLAPRHPGLLLRLFDRRRDSDPGFAASFRDRGIAVEWVKKARYSDYLRHLDDVAIGLAPVCPAAPFSRGKSFGKVLAYLDRMVPVIGSDAIDHGCFFTARTGVITNDRTAWVTAASALLGDPHARQSMSAAGFAEFSRRLTTEAAASRVAAALDAVRQAQGDHIKGMVDDAPGRLLSLSA